MADADNSFGMPQSDPIPVVPTDEPGKKGLMSGGAAKVLIIVGAILGLLVVGAVVAGIFLLWGAGNGSPTGSDSAQVITTPPTETSAKVVSTETSTSETTVTVPVSNDDVFAFRNPFVPTIAPVAVENEKESTATVDPNVLTLQNIVSKDGELQAVLAFGGVTYTAGEGDQLGTTPWKVLTVNDTSVSMLYGDVKVTLSLGEGVAN